MATINKHNLGILNHSSETEMAIIVNNELSDKKPSQEARPAGEVTNFSDELNGAKP